DRWHRLEIGERHGLAAPSLLDRLLRLLPRSGDPVENLGDSRGILIGFVQSAGQERTRQRDLLYVRALSEAAELACVIRLESDVDSAVLLGHASRVHDQ